MSVWTDENIKKFWQKYKSSYAADSNAHEILRLSKKYIKGEVLDVGASSGALIKLIPNAIGVDIAPKNESVLWASIDGLPFDDKSFDTVFCTDVLEHLTDNMLYRGLNEVNRVLNIGGKLILTIPNEEELWQSTISCPQCQAEFHRWGHIQVFNVGGIKKILFKHSFKVIKIKILPLALMAQNRIIRQFYPIFVRTKSIQASDLFVVAEKC